MDGPQIALFAAAAYFAVRTLLGLMRHHEAVLRAERAAEQAAAASAKPAPKPPSPAKRPAA